jgi:hypothetical protein
MAKKLPRDVSSSYQLKPLVYFGYTQIELAYLQPENFGDRSRALRSPLAGKIAVVMEKLLPPFAERRLTKAYQGGRKPE